jgi:hypothetical protein
VPQYAGSATVALTILLRPMRSSTGHPYLSTATSFLALAIVMIGVISPPLANAATRDPFQSSGLSSSLGALPGAKDQATGISCMPDGPCVAVDYSGQVYELSGSHVAALGTLGFAAFGVSCPTRNMCVVVSDDAVAVMRTSGVVAYRLAYSPQSYTHWQSISCPSPTFCMAGGGIIGGPRDGAGVVASWNGFAWSGVHVVLPDIPNENKTQISSMSCTGPHFCVAADQNERIVQWNGTRWFSPGSLKIAGDSFTVSCTSQTFCLALGSVVNTAYTWNGHTWVAQTFDAINDYGVVSCQSPVNCVAVDEVGQAQRWGVHGWAQVATVETVFQDFVQGISCSSAGFCEAVTAKDHFIYLHDPRKPPRLPVLCVTFGCRRTTV